MHARPTFFLPVKVLRTVFRGKLVAGLRAAFADGRLTFPGALQPLASDTAFRAWLRSLHQQRCGRAREAALRGSRARAALPRAVHPPRRHLQSRLVAVTDDTVAFRWKDYRPASPVRTLTLDAENYPAPPPPRPAEALRPDPLLRPARPPVPRPPPGRMSRGARDGAGPITRTSGPGPTTITWPCPRCGAPMRLIERLTARQLPRRHPRRRDS